MNVETIVTGEDAAARRLRELADRASDAKPALERVAVMLQRRHASNFAGQGSAFGGWPPLAAATVARKGHSTPLVATGALQRAMQPGRGKGKVRRVSKTRVTLGTSLFYARFHQAGGRPVVGITGTDAKVAVRMIERYIATGRAL